jgi:histidine triad (HIT) family protein
MNCVFCGIAGKEIKSAVVHETEKVVAFDDANSQAPVHVVIIPREHILSISGLNEVLPEIFTAIDRVSKIKGVQGTGYRVVLNIGRDSGQAVPHLHFHLLGGRALNWPPG